MEMLRVSSKTGAGMPEYLASLEARLAELQSRIRPHFLFNSMNTIAAWSRCRSKQACKASSLMSWRKRSCIR